MKVTLKRSLIGTRRAHRRTLEALGLKRRGDSREVADTPDMRGMVNQVAYLLEIEGQEAK
ncbi:MAG TPA: 50S ribosomal protein L30 [Trueperaceae bacterium]